MKKYRALVSGLAVALLSVSAATAAPPPPPGRKAGPVPPPPPPPPRREARRDGERKVFEKAPDDIRSAWEEMRSLRKDLDLELRKDNPDAAKAMEMLKKSEELHAKVREWHVKAILDGDAPKPGSRGPRHEAKNYPARPEASRRRVPAPPPACGCRCYVPEPPCPPAPRPCLPPPETENAASKPLPLPLERRYVAPAPGQSAPTPVIKAPAPETEPARDTPAEQPARPENAPEAGK